MIIYLEESLASIIELISNCVSPFGVLIMFFAISLIIIGSVFVAPALIYSIVRIVQNKAEQNYQQ